MNDDEVWVQDPKHICLIAKMNLASNQLQITSQGVQELDAQVDQVIVEEMSNIKVDPLSKLGVNDLLTLNELSEFNSLHGVRVRYYKQQIYTQVGIPILVAVNPYQNMDNYYNDEAIKYYKVEMGKLQQINKELLQQKLREIEPHLFKVAQMALDQLFEQQSKSLRICSMIISGESGSGKTESTKKILKYLAKESRSGLFNTTQTHSSIEQQVFASNPLLEAFGNAKTARNDNSSRFGKFIHLYFNNTTKKIGSAKIDNYLLEKSRVVKLSGVERNYHIFYQLIAGNIPELYLGPPQTYKYLKDGDLQFHSQERQEFLETSECFDSMNFTPAEKMNVFKIVAGILHLGNAQLQGDANNSQFIDDQELAHAASLLGMETGEIDRLVCHRLTTFGNQQILKDNSLAVALSARDSLSKYIYNKLFDWLIGRVNLALQHHSTPNSTENHYMIGILDIFGFEIFEDAATKLHTNSFEQLNINFTNEKLQQHFNSHMLETEQVEYNQERIAWQHIVFPDNKVIIDLIENPKSGIYRLLNDQCFAPNGSDESFLNKLKGCPQEYLVMKETIQTANMDSRIDKNAHRFARFGWFCVKHFAGGVIYNVDGFVEKNKDQINSEVYSVMSGSKNPIIVEILGDTKSVVQKHGSQNVLTFFQEQLKDLLTLLNKSLPQYIRCIKPNNNKRAFELDAIEVRRQMRCAGLLEAIQIRKAGYEIRVSHDDFIKKYRFLAKGKAQNIQQMINLMLQNQQVNQRLQFEIGKKNIQIGVTKIFMKEAIRDYLDQLLIEYRMKFLIKIQRFAKKYVFKVRIIRGVKELLKKRRKLIRNVKTWLLRREVKRRISRRQYITRMVKILHKYTLNNQFNRWLRQDTAKKVSIQKQKEIELKRLEQEQIDLEYRKITQQQQTQQQSSQQLQQSSDLFNTTEIIHCQQMQQSIDMRGSFSSNKGPTGRNNSIVNESMVSNSSFSKFTEIINKLEVQLKEERRKRREAEETVASLERDLSQQRDIPRETLTSNMGYLDDLVAFEQIMKQKATAEAELEQIRSEKLLNDKKNNRKIEELTKQVELAKMNPHMKQQYEDKIADLEQQLEMLTNEYFNSKQDSSTIEQQWEDQILELKNTHRQQLEEQANRFKVEMLKQKQQGGVMSELEREKKRRIELEGENQKLNQLYLHFKQIAESEQVEVVMSENNNEQLLDELTMLRDKVQQKDKQIQELRDQVMEAKKHIVQHQQSQLNQSQTSMDRKQQEDKEKVLESLRMREQQHSIHKKLISVMNNIIKLKLVEVNCLHKHFQVGEQNKNIIYKDITQVMSKEKLLMQKFEGLLKDMKKEDTFDEQL